MSDTQQIAGSEPNRIGTGTLYECKGCGFLKPKSQFTDGVNGKCDKCQQRREIVMRAGLSQEDIEQKKFDLALEELRDSQSPAIPRGVQRAHEILGGKTSTELVAEMVVAIRDGHNPDGSESSWMKRDPKLYKQGLELLQRAEKAHDDFLKQKPPDPGLTWEQAQTVALDTVIQELTTSKETRMKVFSILYQRVPSLIDEILQIGQVDVLAAEVTETSKECDLEEAGVL